MQKAGLTRLLAALLGLLPPALQAADPAAPAFSEAEIRQILSHGPWPVAAPVDPTNRASGKMDAIELGTRLFFDTRLSANGKLACGSCHVPERNWTDNLPRGVGAVEVERNTPTLSNLRAQLWFGWDGGADSLWSQSLRPILDKRELGATARHVAQLIRGNEQMSCRYRKALGAPPPADDEEVLVGVGKVLASFMETLVTQGTPFDRFRDAIAQGVPLDRIPYSDAARRGLKIFIGKGACTTCHSGPTFTGGEFFKTGLSRFAPQGRPDPGRPEGLRQVKESRFNLLSAYNDDASGASAAYLRKVIAGAGSTAPATGEFKVPSLRNLLMTAPYGRDGSAETLAEVVKHYAGIDPARLREKDGGGNKSAHQPLNLTPREQTDLVVFLESLSTFTTAWRPEEGGLCQ